MNNHHTKPHLPPNRIKSKLKPILTHMLAEWSISGEHSSINYLLIRSKSDRNCVIWYYPFLFTLQSLRYLDISYNYLLRIDDAVFATMPKLAVLDLSHNRDLKVMDKSFMGLETSLIKLGLENVSLSTVPEIRLRYLREIRLGYNELPSIPQELANNMSNLRMLDLSNNDLTNVPLMTQSLPHLRWVLTFIYKGGG